MARQDYITVLNMTILLLVMILYQYMNMSLPIKILMMACSTFCVVNSHLGKLKIRPISISFLLYKHSLK